MKNKLKVIAGVLLIPIIFVLFYLDRIVLLFLPWQKPETIQKFYESIDPIIMALYRVVPVTLLIIFYNLIF